MARRVQWDGVLRGIAYETTTGTLLTNSSGPAPPNVFSQAVYLSIQLADSGGFLYLGVQSRHFQQRHHPIHQLLVYGMGRYASLARFALNFITLRRGNPC